MRIDVEYTGQLRHVLGKTQDHVELTEGATLADLVSTLSTTTADAGRAHLLNSAGLIQPSLLIALNGSVLSSRQACEVILHDEDRIVLLPPIAGG